MDPCKITIRIETKSPLFPDPPPEEIEKIRQAFEDSIRAVAEHQNGGKPVGDLGLKWFPFQYEVPWLRRQARKRWAKLRMHP